MHKHFELLKSFILFKHKNLIEIVYNRLTPKFDARCGERTEDYQTHSTHMFHANGLSKGMSHSDRRIENQFEQEEVEEESRLRASLNSVEHRPWHPNYPLYPFSLKLLSQATIIH
jgi:hypothetical protein